MTFSHTGTPNECMSVFEQFLQEQAPEKPRRNHMVMVAEHIIHAMQRDKLSVHKLDAEVDLTAGIFILKFVAI